MSGNLPTTNRGAGVVRFAVFEAHFDSGQLRRRGVRMRVRPQSFQVLRSLLERPGEVVTREELQRQLWPDEVFVDFDKSLNTAVGQLRAALHDSADHPRFIETLPRRGYRFIADVEPAPAAEADVSARRARLVVLPFANLSGDPAQDYFSDAMTDEIITALASLAPGQLAVIARTTAMHYKGSRKDVNRIGGELNVGYVVEGGVLSWNDQVTINVQLIRTSDEAHLFAKKYDAPMRDMFSLHVSIAQDIAGHVPVTAEAVRDARTAGASIRRPPTGDLAAYNEYIKGRQQMWLWTPESTAMARQHFEKAIERDPTFALAYCDLARVYWYIGFAGFAPSRESDRVGRFYALRAIETDPTLAEGYALLSYYPKQRTFDGPLRYYDWTASLADVMRARELNPRSQLVQIRYSVLLMVLGRLEEAVAELEQAVDADPLSIEAQGWLVEILYLARQYERALEQGRRVVELEPDHLMSYWVLGQAYLAAGKYDESAAAARRALELSGGLPLLLGWLGLPLGLAGHKAEARTVLDRLHALASERYVPPTAFAWTHLGLGNIDEAFEWMDRAVDAPDRMMSPIKTYPFLDPIRADTRFSALVRKMNLES